VIIRIAIVFLISLTLMSCDPAYHLAYAVVNNSSDTVYCLDKQKPGEMALIRIDPDSTLEIYSESGFGSGRRQFKESRPEVQSRFLFYSDSTLADSCAIHSTRGWKFYPLPIGVYNARIYIRNRDLH